MNIDHKPHDEQIGALQRAINHFDGSQSKLARAIGVKPQNVWVWVNAGKVSAEFIHRIELVTDGYVKAVELRPDIFQPVEKNELVTYFD